MNFIQAIFLGIVQGITEFLPVSSSAHLVLVPYLLGWEFPPEQVFPFDVLVQLGTILAVIIYFWKDLVAVIAGWVRGLTNRSPFGSAEARLGWWIILATIPAGLVGISVKDQIEQAFSSPALTAVFLFVTALLLVVAEIIGKRNRRISEMSWLDALIIGLFQALSVFPGISRSGSTITGAMFRNLDRREAARFSFLMSVPIMLAAGGLSFFDLLEIPNLAAFLPVVAAGFITAAVVGYFVIAWLLAFLTKRSMVSFAIYCLIIGAVTLFKVYVL